MPNFSFHIRHGIHSSDHNVDLPDVRAAHEEATMIFGDMARDVATQLNETSEWRMDVSDASGKSLFRLLTEPLNLRLKIGRFLNRDGSKLRVCGFLAGPKSSNAGCPTRNQSPRY